MLDIQLVVSRLVEVAVEWSARIRSSVRGAGSCFLIGVWWKSGLILAVTCLVVVPRRR